MGHNPSQFCDNAFCRFLDIFSGNYGTLGVLLAEDYDKSDIKSHKCTPEALFLRLESVKIRGVQHTRQVLINGRPIWVIFLLSETHWKRLWCSFMNFLMIFIELLAKENPQNTVFPRKDIQKATKMRCHKIVTGCDTFGNQWQACTIHARHTEMIAVELLETEKRQISNGKERGV